MLLRIWNHKALRYVREFVSLYTEKQISRAAAGLSYFLLLTVFPLFICVNAFLGLLNLDSAQIIAYIKGFLPQVSLDMIERYLSYITVHQSGALLFAGVIMVLTTASAAFRTIMRIMADLYGETPIGGLRSFLVSILFPFGLLVTIYLSIGVIVTGDWLLGSLAQHLGVQKVFVVWRNLRFLLLFLVFFLFILIISHLAVPKGTPHVPLLVGSVVSSCALVASSILFSWFISMSTRYSLVYGSLVSIVVMMVWLYLCGNILLAGNIISSIWYHEHGGKRQFRHKLD
ncbi:MAG: Ribonuclease [Evtepia sp.]|jgi:YihY family inner membrane protein|nr:Ribonuclease [Evtepia sp.]